MIILIATMEENSSQINPIVFPTISSPTEPHDKLSVNKGWIEPETIAVY
jgi:hypothetical protein